MKNIIIIHIVPLVLNNSNVLHILLICFFKKFCLFLIKFAMCSHVVFQIIFLFLLIFFLWTLFIYNVPYEIHILPKWHLWYSQWHQYFLFLPKISPCNAYIDIQCYNITLKVGKVSMLWTTNGPNKKVVTKWASTNNSNELCATWSPTQCMHAHHWFPPIYQSQFSYCPWIVIIVLNTIIN